ncbi:hypothetical protein Vadar_014904 [Vaccinium darrowii]|uniref:Uncharacterized protein n=1 Tax=Vaccinium darrowii TaxID=229202 RepID=A0ACB7XQW4_9ERIC|nr:hypothetical protein Vadar_014904 [Vaccinium darrowii]
MAENTRSQEFKRLDDAVRKLSVTTEQHGETMEGIKSSIDGLTQLITTLNAKYDLLSEKNAFQLIDAKYAMIIFGHVTAIGTKVDMMFFTSLFLILYVYPASACPMFGGSNPGMWTELIHSVNEELSLICGCAFTSHASAFASVSLGRSKWNGNIGNFGIVFRAETPLGNFDRPSFTVQLNGGTKF